MMSRVPESLGSCFYRSLLSPQGRYFYDCIYSHFSLKRYESMISVKITNDKKAFDDGFAAFRAIKDDHPEFFWIGNECKFIKNMGFGFIKPLLLYKRSQIERVEALLQRTISDILRDTCGNNLVREQKRVYERIARRLTYNDTNDACEHNIVGPVLTSRGVCEGCNALFMLCMRRLGIPCIKVYGKSRGAAAHCWSIVWINGKPCHCDVTWDIPKDGNVRFNYFNVSDGKISKDHFCFKSTFIPVCP